MASIGIDLGTTNSACGVWRRDGVELIPNRLGDVLTPSVVGLDAGDEVLVGRTAKERLITHGDLVAATFKRVMGSDQPLFLGRRAFTPVELSSLVLRSLKEDAENHLDEAVDEAVISVPAYFNDIQRQATKQAAELAGLHVRRLINEPTAAALAYGLNDQREGLFLILDLGGGTFDVSLLEYFDGIMEVHASAGDNHLGGEDFTAAMIAALLDEHGIKASTLNVKRRQALYQAMESAKCQCGVNRPVTRRFDLGRHSVEYTITSEWMERVCSSLLVRARHPIEMALRDAGHAVGDIDEVIFVGGSTRLPAFRKLVTQMFNRLPKSHLDPDKVVARGATIQAGLSNREAALDDIVLTDVCPYTLGTDVLDGSSDSRHQVYLPIIERNTVIPASVVKRVYPASDKQREVEVNVYQGESRHPDNNILLGTLTVPVTPGTRERDAVDIRYSYDMNGLLDIDVTVASTGAVHQKTIDNSGRVMSDADIARSRERLAALKFHPREHERNRELLARTERLYEVTLGDLRQHIGRLLSDFEAVLDRQKPVEIKKAQERLAAELEALD